MASACPRESDVAMRRGGHRPPRSGAPLLAPAAERSPDAPNRRRQCGGRIGGSGAGGQCPARTTRVCSNATNSHATARGTAATRTTEAGACSGRKASGDDDARAAEATASSNGGEKEFRVAAHDEASSSPGEPDGNRGAIPSRHESSRNRNGQPQSQRQTRIGGASSGGLSARIARRRGARGGNPPHHRQRAGPSHIRSSGPKQRLLASGSRCGGRRLAMPCEQRDGRGTVRGAGAVQLAELMRTIRGWITNFWRNLKI